MFQSLTIKNLTKSQIGLMRQPTNTRPIIRSVEENGFQMVIKDFSVNGFVYRNTIGRFLVWREGRAYQRLKGVKGIPVLFRKVNGLALVISKIPGKNLEHLSGEERPDLDFFQKLTRLIQECHECGVAHCDLKRSANTMIDEFGKPYIVDWSTAITDSEFCVYPLTLIYRMFLKDDFKAVTKLKLRFCPESITDEERRKYAQTGGGERAIRAVRDFARKCLQKIA
jgi:serine/threonine protein kinase